MPTRPTTGPDGFILDLDRRVASTEREGLWTIPWGVVSVAQRTDSESPQSAYRAVLSTTFVAVPGRWYDLRMRARVGYGGGGEVIGWLTIGGVEVGRWFEFVANASGHLHADRGILWQSPATTSGSVTLVAGLESSGMTSTFQAGTANPGQLSVGDVGPAL
jgi:hypothetical protein